MNAADSPTGRIARNMAVFIDADNLNDATALDHVLLSLRTLAERVMYRRAYGRAESLKGIHAVLWRHGVRPVANLIVDKTTTDSALVIDAVEAVCTNDIDNVAICSGDADFVPLAIWLREKGCRVLCYSLTHKIFANPDSFYDDVVLLDVVEAAGATPSVVVPTPIPPGPGGSAGKSLVGLQASKIASATSVDAPSVKKILVILPELKTKEPMHLSQAAKKLRDAGVLARSASSVLLFRRHPSQFELKPERQPNTVRYRG